MNNIIRKGILSLLTLIILVGCGVPNPIDKFRTELTRFPEYSVVLSDMKEEGNFSSSYFHQYTIVTGRKEKDKEDLTYDTVTTDWIRVPQKVYADYENYLGMTILSKDAEGKISDTASPAGYQYVGDSRYGQWKTDAGGGSFWEFYGKYMFMSSMFNMIGNRINRNDYDNYRTSRSSRRPYFGSNNDYGTNGARTKATHSSFFERKQQRISMKNEVFSRKVSNRVGRSSYGSYRSRGGGFGK